MGNNEMSELGQNAFPSRLVRCDATKCRAVGQPEGVCVYAKVGHARIACWGKMGIPRALKPNAGGDINEKTVR
jgi:hypothetical protein